MRPAFFYVPAVVGDRPVAETTAVWNFQILYGWSFWLVSVAIVTAAVETSLDEPENCAPQEGRRDC